MKRKQNIFPFPGIEIRKRLLGRPIHGWNDNIEMDLKETGWKTEDSGSGQGSVAGFCSRGNEPSGSIKLGGIS
jgi:uncharacterized protein YcnI